MPGGSQEGPGPARKVGKSRGESGREGGPRAEQEAGESGESRGESGGSGACQPLGWAWGALGVCWRFFRFWGCFGRFLDMVGGEGGGVRLRCARARITFFCTLRNFLHCDVFGILGCSDTTSQAHALPPLKACNKKGFRGCSARF